MEKMFIDADCGKHLLDFLSNYSNPKVYFHNLPYDSSFLGKCGAKGKAIQKSQKNKRFRIPIFCENRNTELPDPLALINSNLANFPKMFGLEGEKEGFPYNCYTINHLKTDI